MHHQGLPMGGVLFLIPALCAQGLLRFEKTHSINKGFYSLPSILLTLAMIYLCRIKNPEQLKQCKPGELGRIIGLDRVPEVKCLRRKISQLSDQNAMQELNRQLLEKWLPAPEKEQLILYTDGHVRIYNGDKANLTSKYVSRQKLCLAGTTDFWLNDTQGQPLMVCIGELSEKLQHVILSDMVPELINLPALIQARENNERLPSQTRQPVCTLVFDREAYQPSFFWDLWEKYSIAVITYRKFVKDKWETQDFVKLDVNDKESMLLCEKEVVLDGHNFREVRCLREGGHQTSIVTTNPSLSLPAIAKEMFNRWSQENYFKYMDSDYDLNHLAQYGVQAIDPDKEVVNPDYRKISNQIKKEKEKLGRMKAQLLKEVDLGSEESMDQFGQCLQNQTKLNQKIQRKETLIADMIEKRKPIPPRIKLAQMPEDKRYNKLKTESQLLTNTIKMICYRAETALANLLHPAFKRAEHEKRMIIKQIIQSHADIVPDSNQKTLTITLHGMATPRFNQAVESILETLNNSNTLFPETDLKMIFKLI